MSLILGKIIGHVDKRRIIQYNFFLSEADDPSKGRICFSGIILFHCTNPASQLICDLEKYIKIKRIKLSFMIQTLE